MTRGLRRSGLAAALALLVALPATAEEGPLEVVKAFQSFSQPNTPPIVGADGALYGVTRGGGAHGFGVVYRVEPDGSDFSVLHHFTSGEGGRPKTPLSSDGNGTLFGALSEGERNEVLFRISSDGTSFSVIYQFPALNHATRGALLVGGDGFLYGTTDLDTYPNSYVYRIRTDGSDFSVLHTSEGEGQASEYFISALVAGDDGFLFGTGGRGGQSHRETLFRIARDGSSFTHLFVLPPTTPGPAVLVPGPGGVLYGLAVRNSFALEKNVFRIDQDGSDFAVLYEFDIDGAESAFAPTGLILASDGRLHGIGGSFGAASDGGVFSLKTDGTGYVFHGLEELTYPVAPWAPSAVLEGADGDLYGTIPGDSAGGTLYKVGKDGSDFTPLHDFGPSDGAGPDGLLALDDDGTVYGTTGDHDTPGSVYRVAADGTFTRLLSIVGPAGALLHGLTLGSDGVLYGVAEGYFAGGIVYRVATDGTGFAVLHTFVLGEPGSNPIGNVIEGPDGLLYGTTAGSPGMGQATLFRLARDGSGFETLRVFTGNSNGSHPVGRLLVGLDGRLYGTLQYGPAASNSIGAIFAVNLDGSGYTILKGFDLVSSAGFYPVVGLVQDTGGTLYGANSDSYDRRKGAIFAIEPDGSGFRVLHSFEGPEGEIPLGDLLAPGKGYLYGTTTGGGAHGLGTVFCIRISTGFYRTLHDFDGLTGANPAGSLLLHEGVAIGTTRTRGPLGGGTVFRLPLDLALRPELSIADLTVPEGNGAHEMQFAVTLSQASAKTVTVDYATSFTAQFGKRLVPKTGTLTFAPGETQRPISISIRGDHRDQGDDYFLLNLSHPSNADLEDFVARGTVTNDDGPAAPPTTVRISDADRDEGQSGTRSMRFVVTLLHNAESRVTLSYKTIAGTAKASEDFTATQGTLVFSHGQTSRFIDVPIKGDRKIEPNETFQISLSTSDGVLLADPIGVGTIVNDDSSPGARNPVRLWR